MPPRKNRKNKGGAPDDGETGSGAAAATSHGNNPQRTSADQLWTALKRGDAELITELLFNVPRGEAYGVDPASLTPRPTAAQLLSQTNPKKRTPLTFAVTQGLEPELVLLLLRAGADVNAPDATKEAETALHCACLAEDDVMAQVLLRNGADPRMGNAAGETPLHILAGSNTAAALVRLLLATATEAHPSGGGDDEDAEAPATADDDPYTAPGRRPVRYDPLKLLALPDKAGSTALHAALGEVGYGGAATAGALLSFLEAEKEAGRQDSGYSGAVSAVRLSDGGTALHALLSAPDGDAVAVERVLQRLLPLFTGDTFACNAEGKTALAVAVESFRGDASSESIFTQLLHAMAADSGKRGSDPVACWEEGLFTTDGGRTVVDLIIEHDNAAAAQALVSFFASPAVAGVARSQVARWLQTATPGADYTGTDPASRLMSALRHVAARQGTTGGGVGASLSDALLRVFVTAGAITEKDVATLKAITAAMAREAAAAATSRGGGDEYDEEDGGVIESSDDDEDDDDAAAAQARVRGFHGGGKGAGISRVQQARKARAVTRAAARAAAAAAQGDTAAAQEDSDDGEPEEGKGKKRRNKRGKASDPSPSAAAEGGSGAMAAAARREKRAAGPVAREAGAGDGGKAAQRKPMNTPMIIIIGLMVLAVAIMAFVPDARTD